MMKIAVYTIAKNEEKFAQRWADSCVDADYRVVADTGSADNTVELLTMYGVMVHRISIQPWRFDRARDTALSLVPEDADVCITLDMDEVLAPGWRAAVEAAWVPGTTRLHYRYVWNWTEDGQPGVTFMGERCHARTGYRWVHPVHETLTPLVGTIENDVWTEGVQLHHHADDSKSRGQYMGLLRLAVEESPLDDRCSHYYGRELMYHGEHQAAISELTRHLGLPRATWRAERAASYRYIGRCYEALGNDVEAYGAFLRAISESPEAREPWYEFADFMRRQGNWFGSVYAVRECLKRPADASTYLSDPVARGYGPYDVGSVSAWYAGFKDLAAKWLTQAISLAPNDERLAKNAEFIFGNHEG